MSDDERTFDPRTDDGRAEELVRRAYADHERLAVDGRALDLMRRAEEARADGVVPLRHDGRDGGWRSRPVLFGVAAAGLLLIAVAVGGVLLGGVPSPFSPAGDTVTSATPLSDADAEAVWAAIDTEAARAGTVSARLDAQPVPQPTPLSDASGVAMSEAYVSELSVSGTEIDLDLRDSRVPKVRVWTRVDGHREPLVIGVGNLMWDRFAQGSEDHGEPARAANGTPRWHLTAGETAPRLSSVVRSSSGPSAHAAWSLGSDEVEGVPCRRIVLVEDDPANGPTPALEPRGDSFMHRRLDLWVTEDTGRLLRWRTTQGGVQATGGEIEYGARIAPITPPPSDQVVERPRSSVPPEAVPPTAPPTAP